jgi:hypothetical protein
MQETTSLKDDTSASVLEEVSRSMVFASTPPQDTYDKKCHHKLSIGYTNNNVFFICFFFS